jgi:signal transduction histidine kinase
LLGGFHQSELARAARLRLQSVATDGGLALDNARLFDGTRARAADVARRRVASDLHDGVAQSLAHLRMELELLALADGPSESGELSRLARVAGSALVDLRGTIAGLRTATDGDLATMLERHVSDLRGRRGPEIELECSGDAPIDPDRSEQLLRVAQEALSNAVCHAGATTITVTLERDEDTVLLVVEDDGVGRGAASTTQRGGGVGLRSMHERAEALSGELEVRDRSGGGTVVTLRCPTVVRVDDPKELKP